MRDRPRQIRFSGLRLVGAPLRLLVTNATDIAHLHPYRDQSAATWPVRRLARSIERGLGAHLVEMLRETGRPLLTTYFAPAHAADAGGCERVVETPFHAAPATVEAGERAVGVAQNLVSEELKTPYGTAFYSRGRYLAGLTETEQTEVYLKHPFESRLLTISYTYPAGGDSSVRVQQLLDILAQIEGPEAAPPQ